MDNQWKWIFIIDWLDYVILIIIINNKVIYFVEIVYGNMNDKDNINNTNQLYS
jgi:hypothetical protein